MDEFNEEHSNRDVEPEINGGDTMKCVGVNKANRTLKYLGRKQRKMWERVNIEVEKYNEFIDEMEKFIEQRGVTYRCQNCGDDITVNLLWYLKDKKIRELCNERVCGNCWQSEVEWITKAMLKDKIYNAELVDVDIGGDAVSVNIDGLTLYVPVSEIGQR